MSLLSELKRRNVVRVGAAYVALSWLLIQVAETTFPAFGLGDAAIRTVIVVMAVGLIPALVFAWVFELTPEGLKRDSEVDHDSADSVRMTRRLDRLIMVFMALALGYFAFDKFLLDPARDKAREQEVAQQARSEAIVGAFGDKSIAVLAFRDLSPEGDQEYFSDGISEELLNLLAKIPEIRVAGRTSAFSFKGKDATIAEIGETLNVAHVLEGSVRKSGDRIRITAQLIEARTDTHLWSETYDRTFNDIFAIQDEIASEVVDKLRVTLLGEMPKVRQTDPEAYTLYLQALEAMNRMTSGSPSGAQPLLEEALEIDPTYVPAWILLARAQMYYVTWGQRSEEESEALAREALEQALAIDPDNAEAAYRLGILDPRASTDFQYYADLLARNLERSPNNLDLLQAASTFLTELGRLDQSIPLQERIVAREPLCTRCLYFMTFAYMYAGRYDDAETAVRRLRAIYGGGGHTHGVILLLKGENEAALNEFDALGSNITPSAKLHGRALALYALGRQEEFEAVFSELREEYGEAPGRPYFNNQAMIAQVYAWIGDRDAAFEWLDRAMAVDDWGPLDLHLHPLYWSLHDDPRWLPLLARSGRTPEELARIRFELPESLSAAR
mgnify:CR=1 FL=1